jgi:hypothetical protein
MAMDCTFLAEAGGSNRRVGLAKAKFGNVGNLTASTARVNYATSGFATENPCGGSQSNCIPMIDSNATPSGGATAFRSNSNESSQDATNGGRTINVGSDDAPSFGPYKLVFPNTTRNWASTLGGYDFKEFIVGYSTTFPRTYVVIASASWTIRYVGTRQAGGEWVNTGSVVTLQGVSQSPANFTISVTNGAPQSGTSSGIQVLGLSYANEHSAVYTP